MRPDETYVGQRVIYASPAAGTLKAKILAHPYINGPYWSVQLEVSINGRWVEFPSATLSRCRAVK